ncbi:MAG: hypothetical protein DLM73_06070 [Chthoniobacterales bacterium]|nr:MAG: hypothetical protein DLM73_06070 [Chthoniobacterales bacterium]
MHKDKPPGMFDFAERSIRYLIGFWLAAGFLLSLVVHVGMLVWRVDSRRGPERAETLESKTAPMRKPTSPPTAPDVRY